MKMKMAFVIFDQMTTLDFIGFFDAITRLTMVEPTMELTWDICAVQEEVRDDRGIAMKATKVYPDLSAYDLLFVPGGWGTRELRNDPEFVSWLQTAAAVPHKVSVCTGALLLGAAGFLNGKRATTNSSAYELLEPYCQEVVRARIVRDDKILTGGGVSTSLDLGLFLVELLTDAETARKVQTIMDYPYYQTGKTAQDYQV
jgi:transcriptional regulator GlxA family with amidase domain